MKIVHGLISCGLLVPFLLAGCSPAHDEGVEYEFGSDVNSLPSASATLDHEALQIALPLDQYGMSTSERILVAVANETQIDACLVEVGERSLVLPVLEDGYVPLPSWRYGLWGANYVSEYGSEGRPLPRSITEMSAQHAELRESCISDAEPIEAIGLGYISTSGSSPTDVLPSISERTFQLALNTDSAKEVREHWDQCVEEKGYALDMGTLLHDLILPTTATPEERRVAEFEQAECADRLGTVQKLADIEARFQQQFVNEREAQLLEIRKTVEERIRLAQEIAYG